MESMLSGKTFSEKSIESTYKVKSARSMLSNIRALGVTVECYKDKKDNTRYRIV